MVKNPWSSAYMGTNFTSEGEMPKKLFIPKNGFRGGDTFCPPKGGTEREKKGTIFLVGEHWEISENKTKKSKFFQQNKGQLFT